MFSSRLPFIALGVVGVPVLAAPAVDPESVPHSGVAFERLQLADIPVYQPRLRADGSHERLTAEVLAAELRAESGALLHERRLDPLAPPLPRIRCGSDTYSVVDHAWFGRFLEWYRRELSALGLTFRQDGWDCDDFSLALNALVDLAMLRARDHPSQQLIGRMIVYQRHPWADVPAGGLHEIVVFRSERGWWVAEPQNGTVGALCFYPNRRLIQEALFD